MLLVGGGGGNNLHLALCGKCYNLDDLNNIFKTSCQTFFDIISHAYQQNRLTELLNKADGCFNLVLYDLKGKKIIPFATSGGSDMGDTNKELRPSCEGANLVEGKRFSENVPQSELREWINSLN